jgi:hypothetical protein
MRDQVRQIGDIELLEGCVKGERRCEVSLEIRSGAH